MNFYIFSFFAGATVLYLVGIVLWTQIMLWDVRIDLLFIISIYW